MFVFLLGTLILAANVFFWFLLVIAWPLGLGPNGTTETCSLCLTMPFEQRMFLIAAVSGAIGGSLHVATSFASYVGNRQFDANWTWWYLLRVPIGVGLALIVYVSLRAGFFSPVSGGSAEVSKVVNPFGFAAISGMAGLFSKQATDKLKELFDGLFRTQEDEKRQGKLDDGMVAITGVSPATVPAGSGDTEVTVSGKAFDNKLTVQVNGADQPFAVTQGGKAITMTIAAATLAQPGEVAIRISSQDGSRTITNAATIQVT
jgi:hypothetical protein